MVDARELVFEIVDPVRACIEALAFDPALVTGIGSATLAVGNERVPLASSALPAACANRRR